MRGHVLVSANVNYARVHKMRPQITMRGHASVSVDANSACVREKRPQIAMRWHVPVSVNVNYACVYKTRHLIVRAGKLAKGHSPGTRRRVLGECQPHSTGECYYENFWLFGPWG